MHVKNLTQFWPVQSLMSIIVLLLIASIYSVPAFKTLSNLVGKEKHVSYVVFTFRELVA